MRNVGQKEKGESHTLSVATRGAFGEEKST